MSSDLENASDAVLEQAIRAIRGVVDDWREAATWAQRALVEARAERDQLRGMHSLPPNTELVVARTTERDYWKKKYDDEHRLRIKIDQEIGKVRDSAIDERDAARKDCDELRHQLAAIKVILQ